MLKLAEWRKQFFVLCGESRILNVLGEGFKDLVHDVRDELLVLSDDLDRYILT
jgi:hypothetical protein